MGLDELKDEVLSKAKKQAQATLADAKEEEDKIMKYADKRLADYKNTVNQDAKKVIAMIERRKVASSKLEIKKEALAAKKKITEGVFKKARQRLTKLDSQQRESHIQKLINKVKGEMDVSKIYCNNKDIKFVEGFGTEETKIIGGIIAENNDKTIRIDYSYETMLGDIKEENIQEIAKTLFKE
ncbi:MAG: V-type ATP synthase subunit E family protein [Nanoarchaeota archaeon]|nr:V-type ATP synthase subunit E family protein [Nanoarchaeota archaeon]